MDETLSPRGDCNPRLQMYQGLSSGEVGDWVADIGLPRYREVTLYPQQPILTQTLQAFEDADIDGNTLLELST